MPASTAFHRPPREYPPPLPTDERVVAAPPANYSTHRETVLYLLFPVVGSLGIFAFALVYRNKLFLYIACAMVAITIFFALAVRYSHKRQGKRSARRQRRRYRDYLAEQERALADLAARQRVAADRLHPDLGRLWTIAQRREQLWERRPGDADFLELRVGRGPVPHASRPRLDLGHNPMAEYEQGLVDEAADLVERWRTVPDLPVPVSLAATVISFVGPVGRARAAVRATVTQAVVARAPVDLRLIFSYPAGGEPDWEWAKWLPHARRDPRDAAGVGLAPSVEAFARLLEDELEPRIEQLRTFAEAMPGVERPAIEAPHLLIVLDGFTPGDRRARLPLLREALTRGSELRASVLCTVEDPANEPAETGVRLRIPERGPATVEETGPGGRTQEQVELDEASPGSAEAIARLLAPVRLEDAASGGGPDPSLGLPALLGLPEGDELDPRAEWAERPRSLALRTPIGIADSGEPLVLDLKQAAEGGMGPHGLVIGATGSGKSELLRTLVTGLALAHAPDDLAFVFVDFKGGAAFAELEQLPHTAGMITNLQRDLRLVDRMHDALYGEQERRQALLRDAGNLDDVLQYRRLREQDPGLAPLPDLLVVIDEFGELLASRPDFIDLFVAIGRVGRSLGIHLLFSSQRFDEGRLRGLESHLRYRICLRTFSPLESKAVLGSPDAYLLPPDPGLGYLKVDTTVYERFRTVLVGGAEDPSPAASEVGSAVIPFRPAEEGAAEPAAEKASKTAGEQPSDGVLALVERLARAHGGGQVHQVWVPPLVAEEPLDRLPVMPSEGRVRATVGTVDLPREQRTEPLVLDFSSEAGHLAVVGAPQSGKSTVLRTLMLALARAHTPEEVQFHAIDLGGGLLRALEELPHVGTIAGKADRELVRQILRQAKAEVERREAAFRRLGLDSMADARALPSEASQDRFADLFLVLDGWAQLRRDFQELDFVVEEIAAVGLTYGVHVVVTAGRWADMRPSFSDSIGGRLELRLNDPLESEVSRKVAEALPKGIPGRGLVSSGREFQTALPRLDGRAAVQGLGEATAAAARELAAGWEGQRAPPVRVLPLELPRDELADSGPPGVPIGVEEMAFETVQIDPTGADPHFVVLGDAESGRTNLLRTIVLGLARWTPEEDVEISVVDPRRTLTDVSELTEVRAYASTSRQIEEVAGRLAAAVEERLAGDLEAGAGARGPAWSGPRRVLVVDDYDLVAGPQGNPLAALGAALQHGRDAGFHAVVARRVAGTTRAAFEPFFQKLTELRSPGLILSGDAAEGPILDGHRAGPQPPGRGLLVQRGRPAAVVQTALTPPLSISAVRGAAPGEARAPGG